MLLKRQADDWLNNFVAWSHYTEPPVLYRLWVGVSTIAAALGRRVEFRLGTEVFYPNFFVVLVGPPAARKGTAMRLGKRIADQAGIEFAPNESTVQGLIDIMKERDEMSIDEFGTQLFHASINVSASELTVFLGYNNFKLLGYLCDWYDCPDVFRYKTIGRGDEVLNNIWVNLQGATTPSLLRTSLPEEAVGSGFASRTIFVYEEDKGRIVVIPGVPNEMQEDAQIHEMQDMLLEGEKKLVADLMQMRAMQGRFREGPGFRKLYYDFRMESEERKPKSQKLEGYEGRRPLHAVKLAMIMSASRDNELVIRKEDLIRAIGLLEETEVKMARTFMGVGANPLAAAQEDMRRWLSQVKRANLRMILERYQSELTLDEIRKALVVLHTLRIIKYDMTNELAIYLEKEEKQP